MVFTAGVLAEIRGTAVETFAATTTANVHRLFDKLPSLPAAEAA